MSKTDVFAYLRSQARARWDLAVDNVESDLLSDCAQDRDRAMVLWSVASAAAEDGRWETARTALLQAQEIADDWGNTEAERDALELVVGAQKRQAALGGAE